MTLDHHVSQDDGLVYINPSSRTGLQFQHKFELICCFSSSYTFIRACGPGPTFHPVLLCNSISIHQVPVEAGKKKMNSIGSFIVYVPGYPVLSVNVTYSLCVGPHMIK